MSESVSFLMSGQPVATFRGNYEVSRADRRNHHTPTHAPIDNHRLLA